jgi:hypothetical protein
MKSLIKISHFFIVICMTISFHLASQKYNAPLNIEIKLPRIKAVDLNNNLDIFVHSKLNEFFSSHQRIFNLIDRSDISKIEEERTIHKANKNNSFQSSAMLGTQIIIESTLKNFKVKIDSACVVTTTDKGSLGSVKFTDKKISNCSLYIMTYTFDIELSSVDVETGTVIETITLQMGSEGTAPYNKGVKDLNLLKNSCINRLHPCFNQLLKESSLFVTKVNIPVIGLFEVNEKKQEAKELLVLGSNRALLPFNLKMDIFYFEDEIIGDETLQRQKVIGTGSLDKSVSGHFILDVSKGEQEIFSKFQGKKNLYCNVGKNMLTKKCLIPLVNNQ